jgi:hypothetical protein
MRIGQQNSLKLWPCRFQAVHLLQQWNKPARIQCCLWFSRFVRERVHEQQSGLRCKWSTFTYQPHLPVVQLISMRRGSHDEPRQIEWEKTTWETKTVGGRILKHITEVWCDK